MRYSVEAHFIFMGFAAAFMLKVRLLFTSHVTPHPTQTLPARSSAQHFRS